VVGGVDVGFGGVRVGVGVTVHHSDDVEAFGAQHPIGLGEAVGPDRIGLGRCVGVANRNEPGDVIGAPFPSEQATRLVGQADYGVFDHGQVGGTGDAQHAAESTSVPARPTSRRTEASISVE